MKLFLYSGGSRKDNHNLNLKLKDTLSIESTFTFIPSASDEERKYYKEFTEWFGYYGYSNFSYFDLEKEYDEAKIPQVLKPDAIYLSGGNTYHFLRWILRRKLDTKLREYVRKGGVLIGLSAGAMLMTQSIELEDSDNEHAVDPSKSLKLVNFEIFPHYRSPKYYEGLFKKTDKELLSYSKKRNWPVIALREGEGIIVRNNGVELVGSPEIFCNGNKNSFVK